MLNGNVTYYVIGLMKLFGNYEEQWKIFYYARYQFKKYGWVNELFKNNQELFNF